MRTLLIALCCILLPIAAQADAPAPKIHITLDETAVRMLISLIETKDSSDSSVDKWLNLPANQNLLRVGTQEENLTRDQLKANAVAVITGTATPQNQPPDGMGSLLMTPLNDYKRMLDDLQTSAPSRIAQIVSHDVTFSPSGTNISETVYLHLGGDWDALNVKGDVYINMRFWHDNFRPSWDGFNMVVAHETMHTVQNAAYGNPEAQDTADGAWLSALSKIQREGTARYVEYNTDPTPYTPYTYGFYYRGVDSEQLRAFPQDIKLLSALYTTCYPAFDHDKFVESYESGISDGGPYYDIGNGIAKAIDEKMGRGALIETIQRGPKDFFGKYAKLTSKDKDLPQLPSEVATQVKTMKERLN